MPEQRVPILIAGGGTVGLSAALFLAHHGVPALAVERRAGLSIHPRALGVGVRTVEILRGVGLEEPVCALRRRLATGQGRISRGPWPAPTGRPSRRGWPPRPVLTEP